jgi:hypothetical protein
MIALVDDHGMIYYPEYKNGAYSTNFFNLPVGNMSAVSRSNEYLPVQVPFQVRQDETTGVSVKLAKGPRIVFRPKEGATPLTAATSVAFRITTPDGKPVMQELDGPLWGSVLAMGDESAGSASFTVKPGTYLIKASIFEDDHSWGCQPDLTDWSGEVKVKAGEDTVVELPQNR